MAACLAFLSSLALAASPALSPEGGSKAFSEEFPLFEGLDSYSMPIGSSSKEAQRYFNQGLLLYYGYNYPEAARSFHAASLLDPDCAICCWGECLSLFDCIGNDGDKWHRAAILAFEKALKRASRAPKKERELIETLQGYFSNAEHPAGTQPSFFSDMDKLLKRYPDDPDVAAVYANTGLKAIDFSKEVVEGRPVGQAEEMIEKLKAAMAKHPDHPGLNHFYIHAMEAVGTPEKALEAAKRLDGAVPGSGHLEHMPAHIYFLYGLYHDASKSNQSGIEADNRLFAAGGLKEPDFAGFYLHNYYFLFDSLMMEGRSSEAVASAKRILEQLKSGELPSDPYLLDVFYAMPPLLMARSGLWEALLRQAPPPKELLFAQGMQHYALGLAAARRKAQNEAKSMQKALNRLGREYETSQNRSRSLAALLKIASLDLEAQIKLLSGKSGKALASLDRAVKIEEGLDLHMLPWYMYAQQALGAALLEAGRPRQAEQAYRKDLLKHPQNGWALFGLAESLERQGKKSEAEAVKKQFLKAWRHADLTLSSSRF